MAPGFQKERFVFSASLLPVDPVFSHLQNDCFAIPYDHGIKYVGNGLRITRTGTASNNYRKGHVPVFGKKRNACQVQNIQNSGVVQLIQQAEADDVEPGQGFSGFKRSQGKSGFFKPCFHVCIWCVHPLGCNGLLLIQHIVKNLKSEVRRADSV